MTPIETVKEYFPAADDNEARDILWECTAFPASGEAHTRKQLAEIAEKSGGDINRALQIACGEIEAAMATLPDDDVEEVAT